MNEMYFDWGAPMDAGRNDPVIGVSEWGTPVYRSSLGHTYWREKPRPKPERKMGLWEMLPAYTGELETTRKAPDGVSQPSVKDAAALAGGWLLGGLDVPRRALAGEPVRRGDVMATALDAGMMAAPMPAPKGALRAGGMADDAPKGIKAYHGSPHDFDRFSMDKIGTGEGAQAYGHGLYFADSEDVARSYRDALAPGMGDGALRDVGVADGDLRAMRQFTQSSVDPDVALRDWLGWTGKRETPELRDAFMRDWNGRNQGRMYEVNINANPDDFLDWDAPLSGQPQKVRDWFDSRGITPGFAGNQSGNELFQAERRAFGDEAALAESLRGSGVAGVKYLDHGSRFNAMDGLGPKTNTRNYVVFDENLISILRKYGIGAMVPGAGYMLNDDEYSSIERLQ